LQPENQGIVAFLMKQFETGLIFKAWDSVRKANDGAWVDGLITEKT
jgi:hypothetical protein